jgi:hypothetical protein
MNFRIGVIVKGSLLWKVAPMRNKWLTHFVLDDNTTSPLRVKDVENRYKIPVSIPVRYGSFSSEGIDTFLSNHTSTLPGQGFILPISNVVSSLVLSRKAEAFAHAGGVWKGNGSGYGNPTGAVGLLMNPAIDLKDEQGADIFRRKWTESFEENSAGFDYTSYQVERELPVINQDGFLQIPWTPEMDEFDLLLSVVRVPEPRKLLTAQEIAEQIIKQNYRVHFDKNMEHGVRTFQDEEIISILDSRI